jgi:hypothetical protein
VPGAGFDVSYEHCSLQPLDDPAINTGATPELLARSANVRVS